MVASQNTHLSKRTRGRISCIFITKGPAKKQNGTKKGRKQASRTTHKIANPHTHHRHCATHRPTNHHQANQPRNDNDETTSAPTKTTKSTIIDCEIEHVVVVATADDPSGVVLCANRHGQRMLLSGR
jgi:hypothetical protein